MHPLNAREGLAVRRAARVESTEGRVSAHEIGVDLGSRASALGDGPDHERLPAPAVASGENPGHGRLKLAKLSLEVAPLVHVQTELLHQSLLRAEETHGEEHEVGLHTFSLPSTSSKFIRPVASSLTHRTPTVFTPAILPEPSALGMNSLVSTS